MILTIKNFLSGFTVVIMLVLFSVISHFPNADVVDAIVAVVNDDVILLSELNKGVNLYEKGNKLINSSFKNEKVYTKQIREKVLDFLVDEKIIIQEAKTLGITCTLEEINAAIEHIKKINNCSELDEVLKYDGVSMTDFRQALEKQILKSKIIDKNIYPRIAITDEKIKKYYDNNFNLYDGVLKYHICNVSVKIIKQCDDIDSIFLLDKIFTVLQELESGVGFDNVSEVYSLVENVSMDYVGMFSKNELSENIKKSMVDLTTGSNSKIMKTKEGFQFFHIRNITKTDPKSLETMKNEIYQMLLSKETKNEFDKWLNLVKKRSSIKIFQNNL